MKLKYCVKDFLNYIAGERGLAHNTTLAYKRDLLKFASFYETKGLKNLKFVNYIFMVEFLADLQNQGYSSATQRRIVGCLKTFFKFLKREKVIKSNIISLIEGPTLWQTIPTILNLDEVDLLIHQTKFKLFRGMQVRNCAILELLYGCGLRCSELCHLRVGDLDGDFIRVLGKGSKTRLIPINRRFKEALQAYWNEKRKPSNLSAKDYMFTTRSGGFLDRHAVWRMVKRCTKLAGIKKNISPHTLRHTMASHMLNNSAELRVLQDLMGHSDIGSTGRYLHLCKDQVSSAFEKAHPRYHAEEENKIVRLLA